MIIDTAAEYIIFGIVIFLTILPIAAILLIAIKESFGSQEPEIDVPDKVDLHEKVSSRYRVRVSDPGDRS